MADDEIGGGLLGSASKFGGDVWAGLSGLLGGGAAPTTGQQQDMLAMLSPEDQRRLGLSMLGQLGSTLLAAGQRQTGAQRAEKLAQLGNIGTNIEQSIARNAMLQQQRQAAQRQNELFPVQLAAAKAGLAQQNIAQATNMLALQNQETTLQRNIAQAEMMGLSDQAAAMRGQLVRLQQMMRVLPPVGGAPTAAPEAPAMPAQAAPTMPAPRQEPTAGAAVQAPAAGMPAAAGEAAAAPPSMAAQEPSKFDLYVKTNYPSLTPQRVRSVIQGKGGDFVAADTDLQKLNEEAQQQQLTNETKIRNDFNPKAERYNAVQTAFSTMPTLKDLRSGVADHALILSYYKIFDPDSIVSTTESGQISASSNSIPEALQQRLNKALTGEELSPEMREKIYSAAKAKFAQEYSSYERAFEQARKNAAAYSLDQDRSVPDVRDPKIMATVKRERDIDDISSKISAADVLTRDLEDLQNLNPAKMSKPARDAAKARLDMLMKAAMVPPPVATTEQPQQGYGLGRNPLRGAMQNYPRGLLREDQLPPVGY